MQENQTKKTSKGLMNYLRDIVSRENKSFASISISKSINTNKAHKSSQLLFGSKEIMHKMNPEHLIKPLEHQASQKNANKSSKNKYQIKVPSYQLISPAPSVISSVIPPTSPEEQKMRQAQIKQMQMEEDQLREELEDLSRQLTSMRTSFEQLEAREEHQLNEKEKIASSFEKEFRSRLEALQMRRDEAEREVSLTSERLAELRKRTSECEQRRKIAKKMLDEVQKCVRRVANQYEQGCEQQKQELIDLNTRAQERRERDEQLLDRFAKKHFELSQQLQSKAAIRRSLEEREHLEKLLGPNGLNLLVKPIVNDLSNK